MSLILNKYQVYFLQVQYFQEEKTKSCVAVKAEAIVAYKECMDRYLVSNLNKFSIIENVPYIHI